MDVTDIEIYRDGGTIEFRIIDHPMAGLYRLPPPCPDKQPPRLIRENGEIAAQSEEEHRVLALLQEWMQRTVTPDLAQRLDKLDLLLKWRNLPPALDSAVPVHYIRTVINYLSGR